MVLWPIKLVDRLNCLKECSNLLHYGLELKLYYYYFLIIIITYTFESFSY